MWVGRFEGWPAMRILEIGQFAYVAKVVPELSDFYCTLKNTGPAPRLGWREFWNLRRKVRAGEYDLVVYHNTGKSRALWHEDRNVFRKTFATLYTALFNFRKIAWHCFQHSLRETKVPLVVIDRQDSPRLTETEVGWLDRCQFWFMRELPPNHFNLFLNMNRRCGDVINIVKQPALQRNVGKIEAFSMGFDPVEDGAGIAFEPQEKIYDLFYAGSNHTTTVRQRGMEELRALAGRGMRIFMPEQRLAKEEFFLACSRAWLVWSPEGGGWDCHRHYEALMAHSVPLMNTPTIERLWPLRQGEHGLYYGPEPGELTRAVEEALLDRERLRRIAEQGRQHILEHHVHHALVRHVLTKCGWADLIG